MTGEQFSYSPLLLEVTWKKVLFTAFLIVTLSLFGPFSFFVAVPMTISLLMFGRFWGYLISSLGIGLVAVGVSFASWSPYALLACAIGLFQSLGLSEGIRMRLSPFKIIVAVSSVILLFVLGSYLFSYPLAGKSLGQDIKTLVEGVFAATKKEMGSLLEQGGAESRRLQTLLSNPKEVASEITKWVPAGMTLGVLISLWGSLFMVLRNKLLWVAKVPTYPFSSRAMTSFKAPEFLIWPFIISLALAVFGGELSVPGIETWGWNALYIIGGFYFFQGFGLFLEVFESLGFFIFIRNLLMVFIAIFAWRFVALVGLFDTWFNFRRFFIKGDKQ